MRFVVRIGFGEYLLKQNGLFYLAAALVISLVISAHTAMAAGQGILKIQTYRGPVNFVVEYAITPEEKSKGLMNRKTLAQNHGMLFIYQSPKSVTMWMKNTPLSLDMVFINRMGRIRFIEEKTQPNSTRQIHSGGQVSAVLEVPAGTVENHGIKVGDLVVLPK